VDLHHEAVIAEHLEILATAADPSIERTLARLEYQMISAVFVSLRYGCDLFVASPPDWGWPLVPTGAR
jgi:hypothetical protein